MILHLNGFTWLSMWKQKLLDLPIGNYFNQNKTEEVKSTILII